MATPTSRPVDDLRKAIERRFGGLDRDVQQIKRELFNIPKPTPPAPAAAGTMQGFTRATNSGFTVVGTELRLHGWTFDGDWNADDNPAPALTLPPGALPTEQRFGVVEAGHYGVKCTLQTDLGGGSIPSIRVDWLFGEDGQGQASMMRDVAVWHGGQFTSSLWSGAFYIKAASTFTFPFGVQVYWPSVVGPSCTVAAAEIDVWRLG